MQLFSSVGVDVPFYNRVPGWRTPMVDVSREPVLEKDIVAMIQQRVQAAVEDSSFHAKGRLALNRERRQRGA